MAPKLNILKILTLIAFIGLFIIALMNIFNDGNSYHYHKRWNDPFDIGPKNVTLEQMTTSSGENPHLDDDTFSDYNYREPTSDEITAELEQKLPNVPFAYSHRHANRTLRKSRKCAMYPGMQSLRYYNNYWQTYHIKNLTIQLYGAYYDDRVDVPQGPVIRILAMVNQLGPPFPISYCQVWYEGEDEPEITVITEYKAIWQWGGSKMFFPHLLTCLPPLTSPSAQKRIPQAVAIVEQQCDTSMNMLKVIYNKPSKTADKLPFAVCVKGLDFPYADISSRLVEWLELHRLLGANKVYMYEIAVHPNVKKVLEYYQSEGFVEVQPITLVGGVVAMPHIQHWLINATRFNKRLNELVPYNDCFYRHMYKYEHIALVDVDEVIMPLGELKTWHDILNASVSFEKSANCSNGFAGLCFRNTYHPYNLDNFTIDSIQDRANAEIANAPPHMFLLNHKYRTSNYSRIGYATKCLHRTSKAVTLHNHYALQWINSCRPLNMPTSQGQMQHYHDFIPGKEFNGLVLDNSIDRYRVPLIAATTRVLQEVGLLK